MNDEVWQITRALERGQDAWDNVPWLNFELVRHRPAEARDE